jgi:hypothetical protein
VAGGTVFGTSDKSPSTSGSLRDSAPANLETLHVEAFSAAMAKTVGQQAESVIGPEIQQTSQSTIMAEAIDSSSGDNVIWLLHLSTGKGSEVTIRRGRSAARLPPLTCEFDDERAVVCTDTDTQAAVGSTARQAKKSACLRIGAATAWRRTSMRSSTVTSTDLRGHDRSS